MRREHQLWNIKKSNMNIIENEKTLDDLEKAVKELHQKLITQIENK